MLMRISAIFVVLLSGTASYCAAFIPSAGSCTRTGTCINTSGCINTGSSINTRINTSIRPNRSNSALESAADVEQTNTDLPPATSASKPTDQNPYSFDPEFAGAYKKAEQALAAAIPNEKLLQPLLHFTKEYLFAGQTAFKSTNKKDSDVSAEKTLARILKAIQLGMENGMGENKYIFGSTHKALRGDPETEDGNEYDFYEFGCDFFRPCIQVDNSVVNGLENFKEAKEYLEKGENVVFLANHQSEADPQVMSVCLETVGLEDIAEKIVYVAGHKVTTDPLAIPFSMGRNLICIHSKKHIDADPDSKPVKQRQNLASMGTMLGKLRQGGTALWVAPSGGRDRRDLDTRKVPIAPFDSKTIDMFRLLGNKSKKPTHYYPLAMVTYELCPPPDFIEPGVGEQRNVRFVPVGVACGKELKSEGGLEHRHEFCESAMHNCEQDYNELLKDIINVQGE